MARTFNRNPLFVNSPNRNEDKKYVFNQTNFKGLSNNKNAFTVDQETFSECENVYIDSEGLLKSRPALKIFTKYDMNNSVLSDIIDFWDFDDTKVYFSKYENTYYLTFVHENLEIFLQREVPENVKLVKVEKYIFIFSEYFLNRCYYNTQSSSYVYEDAKDFIYVPIHKVNINGIEDESESLNELTNSYIIRYMFDNLNSINFSTLVGKTLTITLNNVEYIVNFVENNQYVFLSKSKQISKHNFYRNNLSLSVSKDKGNAILMEHSTDRLYIYYTSDFLTFTPLPELQGVIGDAQISEDGFTVIAMKEDDLYALSVLPSGNESYTFNSWTPLITYLNKSFKDEYKNYLTFNEYCSFHAITYDTFIVALVEHNPSEYIDSFGKPSIDGMRALKCVNAYLTLESITESTLYLDREQVTSHLVSSTSYFYKYEDVIINTVTGKTIKISFHVDGYESPYVLYLTYTCEYDNKIVEQGNLICESKVVSGRYVFDFSELDTDTKVGILIRQPLPNDFTELQVLCNLNAKYLASAWYRADFTKCTCKVEEGEFKYAIVDNNCISTNYAKYPVKYDYVSVPWSVNVAMSKNNILDESLKIYPIDKSDLFINNNNLYIITEHDNTKYLYETNFNNVTNEYSLNDEEYFKFSVEGYLLTNKYFYNTVNYNLLSEYAIPYLFDVKPIFLSREINLSIAYTPDYLYLVSSFNVKNIKVDELIEKSNNYIVPSHTKELDNWYFSKDNVLYISSYTNNEEFKWYFPKINTERIDYNITALHAISSNTMCIFTKNNIYYVQSSEQGYLYYKSKLDTGCKSNASVINSYDGKYTLFVNQQGLVALTYQELVESSEQVLTFLSDSIYDTFKNYNTDSVKLYQYDYWIYCYKQFDNKLLVFDVRNNSWWPLSFPYDIRKITTYDNELLIITNGKIYTLKDNPEEYYDFDLFNKSNINWKVQSQKLHLNSIDYCKHVNDLILCSVQDSNEPINLDLMITTYRKRSTSSDVKNFEFKVDAVRTYIKRLNYFKINEIQYKLESSDIANNIPLSLASISIKYKIGGQVR